MRPRKQASKHAHTHDCRQARMYSSGHAHMHRMMRKARGLRMPWGLSCPTLRMDGRVTSEKMPQLPSASS
eukprot:3526570-Lingulodinium_polyedra.AAC.1